jgi:uncharacterized membrane protein
VDRIAFGHRCFAAAVLAVTRNVHCGYACKNEREDRKVFTESSYFPDRINTMSESMPVSPVIVSEESRKMVLIVNILYAASFLFGVSCIVGLVLAYMKRPAAVGTIWEGHFTYAIRTFWIGFGLGMVALVLIFVGIGLLLMPLVGVWFIVRVVRAFLAWNDGVAIDDPKRFF